jgi:two-component system, NarL family, sensor histidine kinase DesK
MRYRSRVTWTNVDPEIERASPAEADWLASHRRWTRGWRSFVFPGVLLGYLFYVGSSVAQYSRGAGAICGYAILGLFAVSWLALLRPGVQLAPARFWTGYGVLVVLFAAELPFARIAGFVMCAFIAIITVIRLGGARSAPIITVLALGSLLIPVAIPSWHDGLGTAFDSVTPLAIPIIALVTFGSREVMDSYRALAQARAELARLAAENERYRIARDLHDLLGHSLTTITVKAGLARRLGATDPAAGLQEIAEVEVLARQSLADVRAAVSSYRDVTLAGELANGRELLRAAGITAELPRAVDVVDPARHELFGWVVREGLTNIVRHANASSCAVRLSACAVEIVDDGAGPGAGRTAPPGHGLSGLRERAAAAGGTVDAGPLQPTGWRLRVSLSPEGSAS